MNIYAMMIEIYFLLFIINMLHLFHGNHSTFSSIIDICSFYSQVLSNVNIIPGKSQRNLNTMVRLFVVSGEAVEIRYKWSTYNKKQYKCNKLIELERDYPYCYTCVCTYMKSNL